MTDQNGMPSLQDEEGPDEVMSPDRVVVDDSHAHGGMGKLALGALGIYTATSGRFFKLSNDRVFEVGSQVEI